MDLIGDIGGTASRLALAERGKIVTDSLWLAPEGGDDFGTVLRAFLATVPGVHVRAVSIAGAGALRGEVLPLTNRGLLLDPVQIRGIVGNVPVRLFNDMVGQGHGLAHVPQDGLRALAGPVQATGVRLVVNIGTGLNACPVHDLPQGVFVPVAEAGNVTLPQASDGLRALAQARGGEVVAEDVISGRALPWLARVLCDVEATGAEALKLAEVRETLALALAAYLRDMVLTHMASGGVYLTGGVSSVLADLLDWRALHTGMVGRRAYTDLLARVPVTSVTDPLITLRGAAALAARP